MNVLLKAGKILGTYISKKLFPRKILAVGSASIETPPNHSLHEIKNNFPLYDEFLPLICHRLTNNSVVIDIGANIGDTGVRINQSNPNLTVILVEPDEYFLSYLRKNIQNHWVKGKKPKIIERFISNVPEALRLVRSKNNSTAGTISIQTVTDTDAQSITFTQLMNMIDNNDVALIKTDTDGFDHKILDNIADYFLANNEKQAPMVYFELQPYQNSHGFSDPNRTITEKAYLNAIAKLRKIGLEYFLIFDNFGSPLIIDSDFAKFKQLLNYLRSSQLKNSQRSIYYYDVLLFSNEDQNKVKEALAEHVAAEVDF